MTKVDKLEKFRRVLSNKMTSLSLQTDLDDEQKHISCVLAALKSKPLDLA